MKNIRLEIYTPDGVLFNGEVSSVSLPGTKGPFTILNNHAPIISSLTEGNVSYVVNKKTSRIKVNSGFVEVKENIVTVCLETIIE